MKVCVQGSVLGVCVQGCVVDTPLNPEADTPLNSEADTPPPVETFTEEGGTHPGMHSCFVIISNITTYIPCNVQHSVLDSHLLAPFPPKILLKHLLFACNSESGLESGPICKEIKRNEFSVYISRLKQNEITFLS